MLPRGKSSLQTIFFSWPAQCCKYKFHFNFLEESTMSYLSHIILFILSLASLFMSDLYVAIKILLVISLYQTYQGRMKSPFTHLLKRDRAVFLNTWLIFSFEMENEVFFCISHWEKNVSGPGDNSLTEFCVWSMPVFPKLWE